ncbi:hypothetical protein NDU88_001109 [Pleurodeles waltl]|uniref:Uncharacterized protein n=1 Tax=Pleurodeles waltl TaxID=8319 RepID=A0AAV7LKG7_PLEWA|nr:hypothetical protein NDU88_001109 [Pleurodeles waltl]
MVSEVGLFGCVRFLCELSCSRDKVALSGCCWAPVVNPVFSRSVFFYGYEDLAWYYRKQPMSGLHEPFLEELGDLD